MYFCCQWANYFLWPGCPCICRKERVFRKRNEIHHNHFVCCRHLATFLGGIAADHAARKAGLRIGRRIIGISGPCGCGSHDFLCCIGARQNTFSSLLVAGNASFLSAMVSYAVCTDIARNNSGTVTEL